MKVEIKFFTALREITGKKVDTIQLQTTITVDDLVTMLAEKYGKKFREYIYDKKGEVQGFLSFLVNGTNINNMQGLDTKLKDKDTVAILPPVGGG
jgi:molybdopterin synthase sulfur carrier subunit